MLSYSCGLFGTPKNPNILGHCINKRPHQLKKKLKQCGDMDGRLLKRMKNYSKWINSPILMNLEFGVFNTIHFLNRILTHVDS